MFKRFNILFIAIFIVIVQAPLVSAQAFLINFERPYAIEYCQYYKTRAMIAGQKARANPGVTKYRKIAVSKWIRYNTCLKNRGWPDTYPIPHYR